MVFPDVISRMMLIADLDLSVYVFMAVVIGILSASANIFGRNKALNGDSILTYAALSSFIAYLLLYSIIFIYDKITLSLYYLTHITMLVFILSVTLILMRRYSGDFMKRHTPSIASYSFMVLILSIITLFVYPGKPYLLNSYIFGFQALPSLTILLYLFFIIPIFTILSFSLFYTIFKNNFERASLYLGLSGLLLIAVNGFRQFGSIYFVDLLLLVISLLLMFGFNSMDLNR